MMSSTMPSAKYSCCGSPLRLVKARTAMDGLSGSLGAGLGVPTAPSSPATGPSPGTSRTAPSVDMSARVSPGLLCAARRGQHRLLHILKEVEMVQTRPAQLHGKGLGVGA